MHVNKIDLVLFYQWRLVNTDCCRITLISNSKSDAYCVLRRKFSAAAGQRKLQFFLTTFSQKKYPTANPKTQAPRTTKIKMAPSEARSIFRTRQNESPATEVHWEKYQRSKYVSKKGNMRTSRNSRSNEGSILGRFCQPLETFFNLRTFLTEFFHWCIGNEVLLSLLLFDRRVLFLSQMNTRHDVIRPIFTQTMSLNKSLVLLSTPRQLRKSITYRSVVSYCLLQDNWEKV